MDHLPQLRAFLMVYRMGSVTRAAEQLHLSQPAVTRQLQLLEHRLGRKLFEKQGRGIVPTGAAHELARQVAGPLDALEAVTDTFKVGKQGLSGTVFLGGPADFLASQVLPVLADLPRQGISIRALPGLPAGLLEQ